MLLKINPYEIIHQIFVSNFGLEKYVYIIKHVNQVNIAENREFQKRFNGFYRVRRDEAWQEQFYGFFETAKVQTARWRAVLYFCRCNHLLGFQIILHPVCLLKCHSVLYSVGTDPAFNLMLDYKFHVYFPSFPAFFLPCLPRSDSLAVVHLLLILLQLTSQ